MKPRLATKKPIRFSRYNTILPTFNAIWQMHSFRRDFPPYNLNQSLIRTYFRLSSTGKQFSLDSHVDLVFHSLEDGTNVKKTEDGNNAITEDGEDTWEGTKGRYCYRCKVF